LIRFGGLNKMYKKIIIGCIALVVGLIALFAHEYVVTVYFLIKALGG
jgi:hypothetical protein